MLNIIPVECPSEILIELHMDTEHFSSLMKRQTALALFREGKLSSGMAARWTGMPRIHFLLMAMQEGAVLLDNNVDDFAREIALL
jgi:predicted HTH domain antitoxin